MIKRPRSFCFMNTQSTDSNQRVDNKATESSSSHTLKHRRYYEKHKEEINKRKRDNRRKQNGPQSIPATAAERARKYRKRKRQVINEQRKNSRLHQETLQQIHTECNINNVCAIEQITEATPNGQQILNSSNDDIIQKKSQNFTSAPQHNTQHFGETQSTNSNQRFEKVQQQLCFDARVSPVFTKQCTAGALSDGNSKVKLAPSKTYNTYLDNQNGDTEDQEQEMNNVFELMEAVYSDHDSEDDTKLETSPTIPPDNNHPYLVTLIKSDPLSQNHLPSSIGSTPKISFKCEHCPNVYPNRGALWQHTVATHSVEKNCECKICGRKFYRNCSLALHLKSHSEEEQCTCKECGKSFSRLINLERHMKIHTGAEQIQCEHCDKTFCDRNNLLRHIVCHLSPTVRTYHCEICSKSYKSEDHLEIHYQTAHASISCSVCGKSFSTLAELSLHDATHAFEHRFVCKFCNKLFSQKAILRKHLTIHIGEKLKCNTCGIEFTQRSSLLRHLKRMHCSSQVKNNLSATLSNTVSVSNDIDIEDFEYNDADVDKSASNDNISNEGTDPCSD